MAAESENVKGVRVNYKGKVITDVLGVRKQPNTGSEYIDNVYENDIVTITQIYNNWAFVSDKIGWILLNDSDGEYIQITEGIDKTTTKEGEEHNTTEKTTEDPNAPTFTTGVEDFKGKQTASLLKQATLRGILGMPYQYSEIVDPPLSDSVFGRKYAEKMIANMPMLLLTPGRPKFMKGYTLGDKDSLLKGLVKHDTSVVEQLMESKNGKFYSFEFGYDDYYNYVNPALNKIAILMGIGDEILDGTPLSEYRWDNYSGGNTALKSFNNSKENVAFFIDSESQIQESFSNDVGASTLAGTVSSVSDMGRELQFLMGATAGAQFDMMKSENYQASLEQLDSFTSKFSNILPGSLMDKLKEGFLTVATGGKMMFPEIWTDSQLSRSYDVQIKLRTPDADKLSIFLNLYVPLIHLIAMTAPQQLGANSYKAPFLVRGYYKGFFNIDMGIITSLNITKGDKCKWTLDGLPTQIDISLSIKDLYQAMSLTQGTDILATLQNTAELDYLSNLCGININKVDLKRNIDIFLNTMVEGTKSKITFNHFLGVQEYISNVSNAVFRK